MKMKRLQMKKVVSSVLFTLLLSVVGVTNAFAQEQIAVLQHEGVITTFYGGNAFVDAYSAAENGDMITLSAGNFNSCSINKCITIHGAGIRQDEMVNDRTKTVILSSFYVNCGGSETEHLIVEGVYFSGTVDYRYMNYAEFFRCYFYNIDNTTNYSTDNYNMSNSKFINCRIRSMDNFHSKNVYLFNSIVFNVDNIYQGSSTETNIIAYNSFIYGAENPVTSTFYNCVVVGGGGLVPQSSCTIYNSVMVKNGYEGSLLEYAFNRDCLEVEELGQVFVDYTGDFNDEQFVLQDEITSTIQGTDGTEVCIYGGMYPFYEIPKYMIMRHCTVGSRTTDDGHLSVDIEVVTEQ